jgi:hypothetical protein
MSEIAMLRVIFTFLFVATSTSQLSALEMNWALDTSEKLAYLNLWGSIEPGDDAKFRSVVIPLLRQDYIIFKINIFSPGGNVGAAMGIGDQIRILQSRTVAPYKNAPIVNGQKVFTDTPVCTFDESRGGYIVSRQVDGPWCTCASACFLIWASGGVREGGYVGIHRLYWKGSEFGTLSPSQARARYETAQQNYTAYLKRLNVPQTIIDRLFATDSHSMYYLTWPEHELMQSTPHIEEMTYLKCGQSKTQHMSRENNWTTTQDINHVNCYRGILKEAMREGAAEYLATLGEVRPEGVGGPFIPGPVPRTATGERYWNHNGSSLKLEATNAMRRFVYIEPREGLKEVGVKQGTLAFQGKRIGNIYKGTAYVFSQKCGAIGFSVKGLVAKDDRSITMKGYAPYVNSECRISGGREAVLTFELIGN